MGATNESSRFQDSESKVGLMIFKNNNINSFHIVEKQGAAEYMCGSLLTHSSPSSHFRPGKIADFLGLLDHVCTLIINTTFIQKTKSFQLLSIIYSKYPNCLSLLDPCWKHWFHISQLTSMMAIGFHDILC
jgi:hypothetical protein